MPASTALPTRRLGAGDLDITTVVQLEEDDLEELAAAIERTGAGHGTTRPARARRSVT